jgi:hypothetical protein
VRGPRARDLIVAVALAAVVGLFVVLSGGGEEDGGSDSTVATRPAEQAATGATGATGERAARARRRLDRVVVRDGRPVGGVKRLEYDRGERVRFTVRSDVGDEVHVHAYDISKDVPAGGSVRFGFPADIEGVFEIELEQRHVQIAELRVTP